MVIDDKFAVCGGIDMTSDRWDTPEHLDDNPRREKTRRDNRCFDSRHEVMGMVDGAPSVLDPAFRPAWDAAEDAAAALRVVVDQVAVLTDAQAWSWSTRPSWANSIG